MPTENSKEFTRRDFVQGAVAGAVLAALPINVFAADNGDMQAVLAQSPSCTTNSQGLQDWIALPSIAAENRNYPAGRRSTWRSWRATPASPTSSSFPTSGKPGVFGTLDAGARTTLGIYFMYDVKQFDARGVELAAARGAARRQAGRWAR